MFDYMLAQERVKDAHREADKNRLIAIAKRSRRNQNRQWLAKMACRFGLTQLSKWVKTLRSPKHLDSKDVSLLDRMEL
jgi:hypothetical protein